MEIKAHTTINDEEIAEIQAQGIIIGSAEDGLDLMGNVYFQGFDKIVMHEKNITPDFFDLSNGMAGEILQKFSNYRVRLAIIGDFKQYPGKSIRDFIYESNKIGHINFVSSIGEALKHFSR